MSFCIKMVSYRVSGITCPYPRQVVQHSCVNLVTSFSYVYWSGTLCARNTVDHVTRIACDFPSHLVRRTIKSMKWIIFGHIWTHRTLFRAFESSGGLTVVLSTVFRVDTYDGLQCYAPICRQSALVLRRRPSSFRNDGGSGDVFELSLLC